MKEIVVMTKKEFLDLKRKIVFEIRSLMTKDYGFKMIANGTSRRISDPDEIRGMLSYALDKVIVIED